MSSVIVPIIVGVLCALIFGVIGFVFGGEHRRKTSEKEIGSATQQATKIINNALNEAEATKKARLVEAKDEIHKLRHDADKEIRERRTEGKKYFSVASGGGTGRTLHPDNMAAGPASYGMTDTMGRMHSDAQFAGSSSVPAHVEMMGLIGMGNNPMVGATVACAVAVAEAL